ncbi:MAG: DUF2262 domain-containing protein, partial [Chloroflexaceae bacterium]
MTDDAPFARQKRLRDQLAVSPVVDVLGVVSAHGAGGGRGGSEHMWVLMFTFDAWRIVGGDLHTEPLSISRKVTEQEFDRLRNMIAPYTVVRIKARVGESAFGGHQALLEEFVGVETTDAELNRHAEELQKPVTFEDPTFGLFTLDRQADWFTAVVMWDGKAVSFSLSGSAQVQEALRVARELWQNQKEWDRRVRDYAVQELLWQKNRHWPEEDGAELSPDEFKERMMLESITVHPDGSFAFWYADGDMFWGHAIVE